MDHLRLSCEWPFSFEVIRRDWCVPHVGMACQVMSVCLEMFALDRERSEL